MKPETRDERGERVIGAALDDSSRQALEKAHEIFKRGTSILALDRLSVRFYDAIEAAVKDDADLRDLVREVGTNDAMALLIGWMLGHPASCPIEGFDRDVVAMRGLVLTSVAAGWSAETNFRAKQQREAATT